MTEITVVLSIQYFHTKPSVCETMECLHNQTMTPLIVMLESAYEHQVYDYSDMILCDRNSRYLDQTVSLRNIALKRLKNGIVIFVDPGVKFPDHWIELIYQQLLELGNTIVYGYKNYKSKGVVQGSSVAASICGHKINPYGLHTGLAWATWVDVLKNIGGFNSEFCFGGCDYLSALELFGYNHGWSEDREHKAYFTSWPFYNRRTFNVFTRYVDCDLEISDFYRTFPLTHDNHIKLLMSQENVCHLIRMGRNGLMRWNDNSRQIMDRCNI